MGGRRSFRRAELGLVRLPRAAVSVLQRELRRQSLGPSLPRPLRARRRRRTLFCASSGSSRESSKPSFPGGESATCGKSSPSASPRKWRRGRYTPTTTGQLRRLIEEAGVPRGSWAFARKTRHRTRVFTAAIVGKQGPVCTILEMAAAARSLDAGAWAVAASGRSRHPRCPQRYEASRLRSSPAQTSTVRGQSLLFQWANWELKQRYLEGLRSTDSLSPAPPSAPGNNIHRKLMSKAHIYARNLGANWIGLGANLAVTFFMFRFMVHSLGDSRYGVWTLLTSLTGYLGLVDIGVRGGTGRYINYYLGRGQEEEVSDVVSTSLLFYGHRQHVGLRRFRPIVAVLRRHLSKDSAGVRARGPMGAPAAGTERLDRLLLLDLPQLLIGGRAIRSANGLRRHRLGAADGCDSLGLDHRPGAGGTGDGNGWLGPAGLRPGNRHGAVEGPAGPHPSA